MKKLVLFALLLISLSSSAQLSFSYDPADTTWNNFGNWSGRYLYAQKDSFNVKDDFFFKFYIPNIYFLKHTYTRNDGTPTSLAWYSNEGKLQRSPSTALSITKSQISDFPSLATVAISGSYNDLSNKPTIPTISGVTGTFGIVTFSNGLASSGKRIETYSGTSNGSGVYTVTFGTSYSVAPNIQVSITNQSATNQYTRVSSVSTTGFTINAYSYVTNSLLGIISLTSTVSNLSGSTIDVLITEK